MGQLRMREKQTSLWSTITGQNLGHYRPATKLFTITVTRFRLWSYVSWHYTVSKTDTSVSEKHAASICRVEMFKAWNWFSGSERGRFTVHRTYRTKQDSICPLTPWAWVPIFLASCLKTQPTLHWGQGQNVPPKPHLRDWMVLQFRNVASWRKR
jgi:hypothetical protein